MRGTPDGPPALANEPMSKHDTAPEIDWWAPDIDFDAPGASTPTRADPDGGALGASDAVGTPKALSDGCATPQPQGALAAPAPRTPLPATPATTPTPSEAHGDGRPRLPCRKKSRSSRTRDRVSQQHFCKVVIARSVTPIRGRPTFYTAPRYKDAKPQLWVDSLPSRASMPAVAISESRTVCVCGQHEHLGTPIAILVQASMAQVCFERLLLRGPSSRQCASGASAAPSRVATSGASGPPPFSCDLRGARSLRSAGFLNTFLACC